MNSKNRFLRAVSCGLLFIALTTSLPAEPLQYLHEGTTQAATVLAPPPLVGSPEQAVDMSAVQTVFHATTPGEAASVLVAPFEQQTIPESEWVLLDRSASHPFWSADGRLLYYTPTGTNPLIRGSVRARHSAPAVGPFFQSNGLPKTTVFFEHVQTDAETVTDTGKDFFKRPRPFSVDPSLASGTLETSYSYPSGHSTESMVVALVLAEIFPDKQDAIVAKARDLGWHRVQIARHYPTDIHAGRVLARAIVHEMDANPEFQKDLAAVKSEISSAQQSAKQADDRTSAAVH